MFVRWDDVLGALLTFHKGTISDQLVELLREGWPSDTDGVAVDGVKSFNDFVQGRTPVAEQDHVIRKLLKFELSVVRQLLLHFLGQRPDGGALKTGKLGSIGVCQKVCRGNALAEAISWY